MVARVTFSKGNESFEFHTTVNDSVLDQALAHGVPVTYSCKRGDCGQCAATLLSGQMTAIDHQRPWMIADEVLLCNVQPVGDVAVAVAHFPELDSITVRKTPCKIHGLTQLAENVLEVVLRLPPLANFKFLPGQFIRLTNPERVSRSYSLAATSQPDQLLRIHIARVEGGRFSSYWFSKARAGDLLQLEGPHGRFFVRANHHSPQSLFLATGTGIAPIYAILEGLDQDTSQRLGQISLYWGNRHRRDEYLADRIGRLSAKLDIQYQPLYSREPASSSSIRYVQDAAIERLNALEDTVVFACGSGRMIASARERFAELGLPIDRFLSDAFTAS
jgi:CDP-4-dehydro-6-deoxyglucose reductase